MVLLTVIYTILCLIPIGKYGCGATLHAIQFNEHKMKCPNVPVRCTAAKQCPWHGKFCDIVICAYFNKQSNINIV